MEHIEEYKKFINNFLKKYSPFKINDFVIVKSFGPAQRPYQITKILVGEDGDITYNVTSPRSFSTIPNKFKISDLEKYENDIN